MPPSTTTSLLTSQGASTLGQFQCDSCGPCCAAERLSVCSCGKGCESRRCEIRAFCAKVTNRFPVPSRKPTKAAPTIVNTLRDLLRPVCWVEVISLAENRRVFTTSDSIYAPAGRIVVVDNVNYTIADSARRNSQLHNEKIKQNLQ